MLVTLFGISMLVSSLQQLNAESPMLVSWLFSPNVMPVRLLQLLNALSPMLVTLFGISMLVSSLQQLNAESPMLVSWLFSPNVMPVRLLQ